MEYYEVLIIMRIIMKGRIEMIEINIPSTYELMYEYGNGKRLLLNKPVIEMNEITEEAEEVTTFRRYAQLMVLPDPTIINLSPAVEMMCTDAVNAGADIWKVFKSVKTVYEFTSEGRETLEFLPAYKAKTALEKLLNNIN